MNKTMKAMNMRHHDGEEGEWKSHVPSATHTNNSRTN